MANELERTYEGSDNYMVQTSLTLHGLLTADLADFTAFDGDIDAGFLADWLAAIQAADGVVRDQVVQDVIEGQTSAVLAKMELCRKKYNEVKYFAGKAFPGNKPVMDEFGTEDYPKARNRQGKLIELMGILHKAADKYKVQLIAQAYSQPRIDEILTLRNELQAANTDQDVAIKGRPVLSNERVQVLNSAYKFTAQVCEVAQLIYADNQVKRDQYVYNPGGGSVTILGTVQNTLAASSTSAGMAIPAGTQKIRFTGVAGGPLEAGRSTNQTTFDGNTTTLSAPAVTTSDLAYFGATGDYIIIRNQNGSASGEYKIEFLG